jgi:hypothetical protein
MIQRGMQRVRSGEIKVGAGDLMAALRLRQQLEEASQPGQGQWQDYAITLTEVVREVMGAEGFKAYQAAVESRLRT